MINAEDLNEIAPWGEHISEVITSLAHYFVTADGKDLLGELVSILSYANVLGLDISEYLLENKDEIVERVFPYEYGRFNYKVHLLTQSIFNRTEELIYQGQMTLGDENTLRFDGQEVHLLTAICWNISRKCTEDIKILHRAAVIRDIRHLGFSVPSGEDMLYPEYEGILQFYIHAQDTWQAFSNDEDSEDLEYINPVRLWPINDNMMIVRTCTEDGLYFDSSRNRLMYRKPDKVMHKGLQRAIIKFPDYYTYRKDET